MGDGRQDTNGRTISNSYIWPVPLPDNDDTVEGFGMVDGFDTIDTVFFALIAVV